MTAAWIFPEFSPVGVDLASAEAVARYDRNQGTDLARDNALLDRLAVGPGTRFVDRLRHRRGFGVPAADARGVRLPAPVAARSR
jgi:putative AdoMet-dependent methyltransferase